MLNLAYIVNILLLLYVQWHTQSLFEITMCTSLICILAGKLK